MTCNPTKPVSEWDRLRIKAGYKALERPQTFKDLYSSIDETYTTDPETIRLRDYYYSVREQAANVYGLNQNDFERLKLIVQKAHEELTEAVKNDKTLSTNMLEDTLKKNKKRVENILRTCDCGAAGEKFKDGRDAFHASFCNSKEYL